MNTYRYFAAATAYGLTRSAIVLHNQRLNVYNYKKKEYEDRSLMFTERLSGVVFGTFLTASMLPFVLVSDVRKIELCARGRYDLETRKHASASSSGIIMDSLF